jgi:HAD superfamily hydrolase (TIGR01450 family)
VKLAAPSAQERPPGRVFAGYVLDLDGTVYLGDDLLPGAAEAIGALRSAGARVVFATNKPLETAADYAAKLVRLGIPAASRDVVTALDSLVEYLHERHPAARLLTVSEPLVEEVLAREGWDLTRDAERADVVVVSFDRTFDYAKLQAAFRAVRHHGAAIVATNPDPYCPTPDGGLPDCAAMLAALEVSTGTRAEAVLGKPSPAMGRAALARLGVAAEQAASVGDRLTTDVALGQAVGMAGILVLTGATDRAALIASDVRPDYVVAALPDLVPDANQDIERT